MQLVLQAHRQEKVIVYMLTCACVDFWTTALSHVPAAKDLVVHALHGKMKQRVRDVKLAAFATSAAGWHLQHRVYHLLAYWC